MANLKDLIVNGSSRILGNGYISGNLSILNYLESYNGIHFLNSSNTIIGKITSDDTYGTVLQYGSNYINIKSNGLYWNNTTKISLDGHTHTSVKDISNGTTTTFAYSKEGLSSATWIAGWNNYELRAISPSNIKAGSAKVADSVAWGNVSGKPTTFTPSSHDHTNASQSADGFMSLADKKKLDGIEAGANKFTYTLPAATADKLGGVKIGNNITNSSGLISLTKANVTAALGYTPPTTNTNTTYSLSGGNGTANVTLTPSSGTPTTITINNVANATSAGTCTGNAKTSSSCTGNAATATTANKLVTSADKGSGTNPVYFKNGVPVACSYTLGQSVTSSSKLTDTTYSLSGTNTNKVTLTASSGGTSSVIVNNVAYATSAGSANSVAWDNVSGKPGSYTPSSHGHSNATTSADGFMSMGDKTKLNKYANAFYGTHDGSKFYKIEILSTATWMLAFTIRVYQGYRYTDVVVSGYQYGKNFWYSPSAIILGDSAKSSLEVYFGHDDVNHLWVGIEGGSYTGIGIFNVTNGYTQVASVDELFKIVPLADICKTVDIKITAYAPWYRNETVSNATTASKLSNSVDVGSATQPVYFLDGLPKSCTYTLGKSVPSNAVFTDTTYSISGDGTNKVTLKPSSGSSSSITINNVANAVSSSKCTGNSATASKLNTNAGSLTQPVYFSGGVPAACTYTLGKSVPSDAKFTDTVYTLPIAASNKLGGIKAAGKESTDTLAIHIDSNGLLWTKPIAGERGPKGETGATGPQGSTGATGPQGPIGPQGPRGYQGEKYVIGVYKSAKMYDPASCKEYCTRASSVSWSDTEVEGGHPEWGKNIGKKILFIIQASNGDNYISFQTISGASSLTPDKDYWINYRGIQGPRGATGATGPQGPKGDKGETGATGGKGATGATGPQGPQGPSGSNGSRGPQGYYFTPSVSSDGNLSWTNNGSLSNPTTVNIKGPKGDKGETGATGGKGATGATGPQGPQGPSGSNGSRGPQGYYFTPSVDASGNLSWSNNGGLSNPTTKNIKGPKGDKGETGATGGKGATGATGPQGPQGPKGDNGSTPIIKCAAGVHINEVGTPTVKASTSGITTTFTFDYLKGEQGSGGLRPVGLKPLSFGYCDNLTCYSLNHSWNGNENLMLNLSEGSNIKINGNYSNGIITYTIDAIQPTVPAFKDWLLRDGSQEMSGKLTLKKDQYAEMGNYALDANNSSIMVGNIVFNDSPSTDGKEGIDFPRTNQNPKTSTSAKVDTFYCLDGDIKFAPNRTIGSNATTTYSVWHSGNMKVTNGTTKSLTNGTGTATRVLKNPNNELYVNVESGGQEAFDHIVEEHIENILITDPVTAGRVGRNGYLNEIYNYAEHMQFNYVERKMVYHVSIDLPLISNDTDGVLQVFLNGLQSNMDRNVLSDEKPVYFDIWLNYNIIPTDTKPVFVDLHNINEFNIGFTNMIHTINKDTGMYDSLSFGLKPIKGKPYINEEKFCHTLGQSVEEMYKGFNLDKFNSVAVHMFGSVNKSDVGIREIFLSLYIINNNTGGRN